MDQSDSGLGFTPVFGSQNPLPPTAGKIGCLFCSKWLSEPSPQETSVCDYCSATHKIVGLDEAQSLKKSCDEQNICFIASPDLDTPETTYLIAYGGNPQKQSS